MQGLCVERVQALDQPLSRHLARHICSHGQQGEVAIVADKPDALLAATRKQWLKLIRQAENDRSSTLNPVRADMLTQQILWMQGLSFTSKPPDDQLEADITFATADDFMRIPPVCRHIYITYDFEREKLHMLTAWMPRNSLVVIYE